MMPDISVVTCPNCSGDGYLVEHECCGNPRYEECCGDPATSFYPCELCRAEGSIDVQDF